MRYSWRCSCFSNKISILFLVSLFLISCGGGSKNSPEPVPNNNPAQFQGSYLGNYTGTTTGTWSLTIDEKGKVTGSTFTISGGKVTLTGVVRDSSKITISGKVGATITFTISIDTAGNVSGNWSDTIGGKGNVAGQRKPVI